MKIFYHLGFAISRAKYEWAQGRKDGNGPSTSSIEVQLLKLLNAGQYIGAIKRYRELTNSSLRDAKDAVDAIKIKHNIPDPDPYRAVR